MPHMHPVFVLFYSTLKEADDKKRDSKDKKNDRKDRSEGKKSSRGGGSDNSIRRNTRAGR
jgi:hypothetical protein